jgi:hypothetical protein
MSETDGGGHTQADALQNAPGYVDPRYLETVAAVVEQQERFRTVLLSLVMGIW